MQNRNKVEVPVQPEGGHKAEYKTRKVSFNFRMSKLKKKKKKKKKKKIKEMQVNKKKKNHAALVKEQTFKTASASVTSASKPKGSCSSASTKFPAYTGKT